MISQEARSEGGQHDQGGLSEGAQHVQVAVSVGEQHDQQSSECMMRPVDGASESDEKPKWRHECGRPHHSVYSGAE